MGFITFITKINDIQSEVGELLSKKNNDYGDDNLLGDGLYGIAIRLGDKINRIKNLCKKDKPEVDESIRDTLIDICGYSLNAIRLLDEERLKLI